MIFSRLSRMAVLAAACCIGIAACEGPSLQTAYGPAALPSVLAMERRAASSGKIQHVIIIVQENRSFDNLFQGYPGADTRSYGYNSLGQKIALQPIGLEVTWDIDHSLESFLTACHGQGSLPGTNCQMDGFDQEFVNCEVRCPPNPPYSFVPANETKPYFEMAQQYVLADHMFTSHIDASSFTSHQYIIAGQSNSSVDFPRTRWGCDGGPSDTIATLTQQRTKSTPIPVCFDNQTLGDELDAAGVSWGYYTSELRSSSGMWSAYQAIDHIRYGPDWKRNVFSPQTKFFKDVADGNLPAVSWVTPTCRNSDHSGCRSKHGPAWVASLVNAVGQSQYWNSSAIFVMWDEYGGWYDHVAPKMLDYDGLGMRVPLLVISPYAKQGYVSHLQYEHGSILRFVEDQFGLGRLAASDKRARSPAKDCFDFTQSARPFKTLPSALSQSYFEREPIDPRIPDAE